MLLKDLQTLATKLATGTLFHVEKAGKAYSVDYSALAKAIIEEYADSTVGGSKQSVQAAIGALNSSFACVNLGSVGGEEKTVASADWVDIVTASNINLPAGKYMFIATINATWSSSGYQFFPGIRVDSNNASSLYNYASPQTNQPVMVMGYLNVFGGTHTISLIGRVTNASKVVTIPAYQNIGIAFIHCA